MVLGNWNALVVKASGTATLDQSRTHNLVNEITGITAAGTCAYRKLHPDINGGRAGWHWWPRAVDHGPIRRS